MSSPSDSIILHKSSFLASPACSSKLDMVHDGWRLEARRACCLCWREAFCGLWWLVEFASFNVWEVRDILRACELFWGADGGCGGGGGPWSWDFTSEVDWESKFWLYYSKKERFIDSFAFWGPFIGVLEAFEYFDSSSSSSMVAAKLSSLLRYSLLISLVGLLSGVVKLIWTCSSSSRSIGPYYWSLMKFSSSPFSWC